MSTTTNQSGTVCLPSKSAYSFRRLGGEAGAGRCRAAGSEGQELKAAAEFARGVLNGGQIGGLGPVAKDIVQVLGISGDLLKEVPGGVEGGQVPLALIFSAVTVIQAQLSSYSRGDFGVCRILRGGVA